jgi:hypothetical protein
LRSATTDLGEPHEQTAYCACECRERWSSRACSNQCKRRLFRLRGRSGHSRRRRRGRNRWERDSEQSSASTTGLLSAPTPRLSSASARSGLSASAGLCSAGTRLSLGTRARLGRRLRLSAAHRTGVPIVGRTTAKIYRLVQSGARTLPVGELQSSVSPALIPSFANSSSRLQLPDACRVGLLSHQTRVDQQWCQLGSRSHTGKDRIVKSIAAGQRWQSLPIKIVRVRSQSFARPF